MIDIGKYNRLQADHDTDHGFYLTDGKEEILLPNKYVPEDFNAGDELDVFVYLDSEERPVATTLHPKILLYEYACLKVVDVNDFGAFLDWGLEKDLFCPFREQTRKMQIGEWHIVYLYLDGRTNRLAASSNINKFVEKENIALKEGEKVNLLICGSTELGYKAIINNMYLGLIYKNQVFRPIKIGEITEGFVHLIREDGKIDLILQKPGYDGVEDHVESLIHQLREANGFLPLTDKSAPEVIMEHLHMSKKNFKKAAGFLYKDRKITIDEDGIRLIR